MLSKEKEEKVIIRIIDIKEDILKSYEYECYHCLLVQLNVKCKLYDATFVEQIYWKLFTFCLLVWYLRNSNLHFV